jgi:hypothetical protein
MNLVLTIFFAFQVRGSMGMQWPLTLVRVEGMEAEQLRLRRFDNFQTSIPIGRRAF